MIYKTLKLDIRKGISDDTRLIHQYEEITKTATIEDLEFFKL